MPMLKRRRGSSTIQARVLTIALVPSIAILVIGVALSALLAYQGVSTSDFATKVRGALGPTSRFIAAVQEERRLSTLRATGRTVDAKKLDAQRHEVDDALDAMEASTEQLADGTPDELHTPLRKFDSASSELPAMRQWVDGGVADAQQIYDFYGELVELVGAGIQGIARSATDAEVGFEQMISYDLFRSIEAQSRSHAMVERAISQGLGPKEFHELSHQMGTYHELLETIVPRMTEQEQQQYTAMKTMPAWKRLVSGDDAIMALGPGRHSVNFDIAAWESASRWLSNGLFELYKSHSTYAADLGTSSGDQVLASSLVAGGAILLAALVAVLIALRHSRRLVRRLTGLREETLDLAERDLPAIVQRLRDGERIDVDADVAWLDHGDDEIGQVATAFNKAQRLAIAATVQEAQTREGVRSVFLNIAHRSQVMVHRQLQVLDKAERSQEDPDQLALLFQLDHLATQSRRNAENLIILGGKQPGRQWRNPVSLNEIVTSAVAETDQYTRVRLGNLADVNLQGAVVADLIHLLAELVDNATSFSPPQTQVDVHAGLVGRGIVIEVEDQGLGIEKEPLEQLNTMLRKAPEFGVMAMSAESRIGLFVVAKLAARHDIRVTLRDSIYGGIRAIVLVPMALVDVESAPETPEGVAPAPVPAPAPSPVPREPARPAQPEALPHRIRTRLDVKWQLESAAGNGTTAQNGQRRPGVAPTKSSANGTELGKSKPPLPQRNRQASLAPQLRENAEPHNAEPDRQPAENNGAQPTAEHFRFTMSALQKGTLRARAVDADSNSRSTRSGDEL